MPVSPSTLSKRYKTVRDAIRHETNDKCAYCEVKVTDVYIGDVEHILPKDADPKNRTLDYNNLTFACWNCNNEKGNKEYNDGFPLLNPYQDDPDEFLRMYGCMLRPTVREMGNELRAQRTIKDLDLNRSGLIESRETVTKYCEQLEAQFHAAPVQTLKDYALQKIRDAWKPDKEHAMLAKTYFTNIGIQ
ncbi:MAG: HNH endonuclease [Vulcanimicrobiaceae bacterium]